MLFDQQTNDYALESISALPIHGKGALAEAAYLRLLTPKGSYFADIELGSELYKLKRSKDVPRNRRQAVRWATEALEPLRKAYYLTDITVTAMDAANKGYLVLQAILTTANGSQTTTTINVQVAG